MRRSRLEALSYVVFVALGIAGLSIAYVLQLSKLDFAAQVVFNLALTITAVTIVQFIWRLSGGDPLDALHAAVLSLRTSIDLLSEVEDAGIIRFYKNRADQHNPSPEWIKRLSSANEIEMMGFSLRADWFRNDEFIAAFLARILQGGCHCRILILDPDEHNTITAQRIFEEEGSAPNGHCISSVRWTIDKLREISQRLPSSQRPSLELHVANDWVIRCSITRIGDRMTVSPYLTGSTGSPAPAMELVRNRAKGDKETVVFLSYEREFEAMWKHSHPYDLS